MFLENFNLYEENSKTVAKQPSKNMPLTLIDGETLLAQNDDMFVMAANDIDRWKDKKAA